MVINLQDLVRGMADWPAAASVFLNTAMLIREIIKPNRTLYHGTCRALIPSIMRHGLEPQAGEFTQQHYGEEDYGQLPDLVFAASKEKTIHACISAMGNAVARHYGFPWPKYDTDTLGRYGALCVIKSDVRDFDQREDGDDDFDTDAYPQVEPNDYYTGSRVFPDYILAGKKLVWWLEKQRARWEPWTKSYKPAPRPWGLGETA